MAATEFSNAFKVSLRQTIAKHFALADIEVLCADLGIDYQEIVGAALQNKVLNLITYVDRRSQLADLVQAVVAARPRVDWRAELGDEMRPFLLTTSTPTTTTDDARSLLSKPNVASEPPLGPIKNRWALLVGINRFDDGSFRQLTYCVADVLAMRDRLTGLGYTCQTLFDDAPERDLIPTKFKIEGALKRVCDIAERDDLILVHFATHGTSRTGKPMLIAQDTSASLLDRQGIAIDDVIAMLKGGRAKRHVLILDACHVGVGMRGDDEQAQETFRRNVNDRAQGLAVLAASAAEQEAQEPSALGHGVFTSFLLDGLAGKAQRAQQNYVTVGGLAEYVLNNTRQWYFVQRRQAQDPTIRFDGIGDMIIADFAK